MSWAYDPSAWSDGVTVPRAQDFKNIATDLHTRAAAVDGGGYGRANTGFLTLVPGALPGTLYTITAGSWAAGTATVTLSGGGHLITVGQIVTIGGVTPSGYNTTARVSAVATTTISYTLAANPGAYASAGSVLVGGVTPAYGMVAVNTALNVQIWNGSSWVAAVTSVAAGVWWSAGSAPSAGVGSNGDMYLNSVTGDVYGPKAGGSWGAINTNIKGVAGATGAAGSTGAAGPTGATGHTPTFIVAAGAPASGTGVDGDLYLDSATSNLYGPKATGAWGGSVANLRGAQGVGYTPRGAYSAGTTYAQGDLVSYGGQNYSALAGSNTGNTPDASPTWWQNMAGSSQWVTSGSNLYYGTGMVGIGVVPGYLFHAQANLDANTIVGAFMNPGATAGRYTYLAAGKSFVSGGAGVFGYNGDTATPGNAFVTISNYGDDAQTKSIVVRQGGFVGIGTSAPRSLLHIVSPDTNTGIVVGKDNNLDLMVLGYDNTNKVGSIQSYNGGSPSKLIFNQTGGNVGIGTASPANKLAVAGGKLNVNAGMWSDGADLSLGQLSVTSADHAALSLSAAGTNVVYLPSIILRRHANTNAGADTTQIIQVADDNVLQIGLMGWNAPLSINNGGKVGIGTSAATSPLQIHTGNVISAHVDALNIECTSYSTTNIQQRIRFGDAAGNYNLATIGGGFHTVTGGYLAFSTLNAGGSPVGPTERMRIDNAGYVGIGLTNATHLLQLSADDACKPSTNYWQITSDVRTKRKIAPFADGLATVRKIHPITYEYNGLADTPDNGASNIGVSAQDVRVHLPYCVKSHRAKLRKTDADETDLLSFNPQGLFFAMLNAIKELDARLTEAGY